MAWFTTRLPGNAADFSRVYAHRRHTVYCISCADWRHPLVHSLHTAGRHLGPTILPCTQLVLSQAFGWMVRQLAEVENNMNSVERIVYYARDLEQEPPHEIPEKKPAAPWPSKGKLEIKDAVLKYRPELPLVLKGLSMTVQGGEK
jgi:ABC-type transport system involved in cytochrome bd biosynthesis fused ATPase/permease subunit